MHWDVTRRRALSLLAAGTLAPRPAAAAAFPRPRLKRGVNLHHLLNWPAVQASGGGVRYVWPPFEDSSHAISQGELKRIVAAGFDFVRVTVDPSIFILTEEPRQTALMARARSVVQMVLNAGLSVVFDLHPVAVNPPYGPDPLVESGSSDVFQAYADMVGRVAAMLREFPPNRVVFELMNEPWIKRIAEAPRWQPMLETLHRSARDAAPSLPLLLTGILWSDYKGLLRVETAPFRSSAVLYTFHYYDPHTFTHQGVLGDEAQYIAGLAWPETAAHAQTILSAAEARIAADTATRPNQRGPLATRTKQLIDSVVAGAYDAKRIAGDFDAVAAWAAQNDISRDRILLGEFGCVNVARGIAIGESRLAWLAAVRQAAEGRGFGWAYWAYKGYGGMQLVKDDKAGTFDPQVAASLGLTAT